MDSKQLAERITDGILDSVDQAGRFEGRGHDRHLTLGSVITNDGDVKSAQQVITEWVQKQIDEWKTTNLREEQQ